MTVQIKIKPDSFDGEKWLNVGLALYGFRRTKYL